MLNEGRYHGMADGKPIVVSEDPDDVWRRLRGEVGRSDHNRGGLALMQIGEETLLVDMDRFEPRDDERAVLINFNGKIRLDKAVCHYPHMNWCGRRIGHVLTKIEEKGATFQETGWIIGAVVEPRAANADECERGSGDECAQTSGSYVEAPFESFWP